MTKLNDIPGKSPFKVPVDYFEEANRKIISLTSESKPEEKNVRIFNRFRPYLAVAASIAGFFIISYFTVKLLTQKTDYYNISEVLSSENPELYINEIDLFSLEENITSSEIYEGVSGVSNSEIIDYLITENIEINDIYDHL